MKTRFKIIISILIFILAIFIASGTYAAGTLDITDSITSKTGLTDGSKKFSDYNLKTGDNKISLYTSNVFGSSSKKYLYCIDSYYVLGDSATYTMKLTLKPSKAYTINGYPLDQIPEGIDKSKFKEYTADDKHVIAYILSETIGETYSKSQIQLALWYTGINENPDHLSTSEYSSASIKKAKALYNKAKAYSTYILNYFDPYFADNEIKANGDIIGPIKVTYKRSTSTHGDFGGISTAVLKANDKEYPIGTGSDWVFCDANGNNVTTEFPESKATFYIKLNSSELKNTSNISLKFNFDDTNAQAYFAKIQGNKTLKKAIGGGTNDKGHPIPYYPAGHTTKAQSIIVFGAGRRVGVALEVPIKDKVDAFDISITKVDTDTGTKIAGAKFRISGPGVANATKEYTTATTGELIFDRIEMPADGTYTYTVTEISVPSQYDLPSQVNTNVSVTIQGRKVTGATITQNGAIASVLNRSELLIGLQIKNKQASKEFDMKITKVDIDTGTKIAGVKFKISGSGVVNPSKEYTTSSTGELTFDKIKMPIDGTYEYTITEISVPAQYDLPSEVNTKVNVTIQGRKVTGATITQNGAATVLNRADLSIGLQIKNKQASKQFDIKVTKVDESNTGIKISGAKFKISGPGVANASKEYTTSTTGELTFDKIQMPIDGTYTYTVTEISVPKPYKLPSQVNTNISVTIQGRKVTSATITQNGAATVLNRADLAIGLQIKNNKTVTITGTVWRDAETGKGLQADGKMATGEQRLANVEVYLVNLSTNTRVDKKITDGEGNYTFTNVEAGVNYRVEFEYDGLKYAATTKDTNIGTITFNNGVCNTNNTNTSKADETEAVREAFNNKFNTITNNRATAVNGSTLTLSYTQGKASTGNYLVSTLNRTSGGIAIYKVQADTNMIKLDNVNLPVREEAYVINNVNLGLVERYPASLALMNDMVRSEVWYQGEMVETNNYGSRDQNKIHEILLDPEKLAAIKNEQYTVEIDTEWLVQGTEVYLTYMVVVQNNSDRAIGTLNEIVQYFDKEFTLVSAWYGGSAAGGGTNLAITSNPGGSNYNSTRIKELNKQQASMLTGNTMTFYLKYKISDIKSVFTNVPINGTVEKVATSEVSSYSFNSSDNLSDSVNTDLTRLQKAKLVKGQIDHNSQPENETHRSGIYEDDGAGAPRVYLKLVKRNNIGGIVWEDDGDGIRQDSETAIQGVTVELYNTTNMGTPARTTETAADGTYMFKNVGNANFVVRFIYGNNDKTVKLAANGGANAKSYNGSDFIATQYQKSELLGSDALDNPGRRGAVTEYVTKDKGITNSKYKVLTSPYSDPSNSDAINTLINETWMYADTGTITTSDTFDNKKGERTDFGIVEKPEVKLKLEKRVSAIRITDNTGVEKISITIPVGEVPEGKGAELVQQIPNKEAPIKYNIELGTELLQGSNIEIEYEIKIINEGSVEATVTRIFDYIDNTSTYNTDNTEWLEVSEADLDELVDRSIRGTIENNVVVTNAEEITVAGNSSVTKKITLNGAFSSTDNEIGYSNTVDIMSYKSDGGRPHRTRVPGNKGGNTGNEEDYDESEDITINSSTGEPRIYYLLGFSILIILVAGVVIIRTKVIKKKE